jgi:hypothetical protein
VAALDNDIINSVPWLGKIHKMSRRKGYFLHQSRFILSRCRQR